MKKNRSNKKLQKKDTSQDYLFAMLSVLSQKSRKTSTCPPPEDIAAFSEGRLRGRKRKEIIVHLNDCALCRRHWEMIGSTLKEMEDIRLTLMEKILTHLKQLKLNRLLMGSGVGLALATSFLLIFLIPQQNELHKMISKSYLSLPPADVVRFNSFITRGEDKGSGEPASKGILAYEAGLVEGKSKLLNEFGELTNKDFKDKWYSLLHSMGQWVVLLQCACISSEPASDQFWSEQKAISLKMRSELNSATTSESDSKNDTHQLAALKMIEAAIQQIEQTGSKADGCDEITIAIEMFENQLRELD